ncbi:MAG: SDR family NAD(P)-dependent oxidoreductase [Acidimicrobiales bacterium]
MELAGRSALVSGGAGGLGAAAVRELVSAGMSVVVFDRDTERSAALVSEIGSAAVAVAGDVGADEDVGAACDAAEALGTLSLVVNVVGIGWAERTVNRDGHPHDLDRYRQVIEVNQIGTFNVARLGAARMAANDPDDGGERGVIVNTASVAGYEGQTGQIAYSSSKAAIIGMSLPMARDLAPIGIRVNCIAPGIMNTDLMMTASEEVRAGLVANVVHPKRFGEPAEYGLLVRQIAENAYLNGECIRLDAALRFPPK